MVFHGVAYTTEEAELVPSDEETSSLESSDDEYGVDTELVMAQYNHRIQQKLQARTQEETDNYQRL